MEIKTIKLIEIKANEGMVLTDGETFSSVGGSVYLGINDSPDNWHEITEAEHKAILKAEEERMRENEDIH